MKLLDSTFLVDYLAGLPAVREYLADREETDRFATTTINVKEIAVGRAVHGRLDHREFEAVFGWLDVLPFADHHAHRAAEIEGHLRRDGGVGRDRLRALAGDVLVGAVAAERGASVVTRNVADFEVLPGVDVEPY